MHCDRCKTGVGRHTPTIKQPSVKTMEGWLYSDREICKATDGCVVEEDGTCEHGHQSWLLVLGVV